MSQQQPNGKQTFTTTKHITPYVNRFPTPKPFTIATIATSSNGAVVSPPPSSTSPSLNMTSSSSPSVSPTRTSPPATSPNLSPTPYSNGGGGNIPAPPPFIPKKFNSAPRPFSNSNNGVTTPAPNNNNSVPPPPPSLPNGARFGAPSYRPAAPTTSSLPTNPAPTMTGPAKPMSIPSGAPTSSSASTSASTTPGVRMTSDGKVDPRDPQVRRLVYNMYRGMLDKKHEKANVMLESAPKGNVVEDAGIGARLQSMMRQQTELKDGTMNAGGPPPPPPPPPIPGVLPAIRLPTEVGPLKQKGPPAALAGAMMKDKKPFTYTPGGLDLSEINTQYRPQQNGNEGDPNALNGAPVQSRSFRVLQSVFDSDEPSTEGNTPRIGSPLRVEVPAASPGRTGVTRVPSQSLGTRTITNGGGNYVIINGDAKPEGLSVSSGPPRYISQNSDEGKELSNRFKSQVRVGLRDEDNPRYRGGSMNGTAGLKHDPQGPVHIPNIRQQQLQRQQQYHPQQYQQQQQQYQQPPVHSVGVTVPTGQQGGPSPSDQQKAPEPKKYMGGKIPSRSFRMLQAMTGVEDDDEGADDASECYEDPIHESEAVVTQADADNRNNPPSSLPSGTGPGTRAVEPTPSVTSPPSSPSPFTPNKGFSRTNSVSSNQSNQRSPSPSLVAPSYTTVSDSKVYRHVSPQITINGPKGERVVNPALVNKAQPPPSPKPWMNRPFSPQTTMRSSSPHTVPGKTSVTRSQSLDTNDSRVDSIAGLESPSRLLKILRQESQGGSSSGPPSPAPDTHRIYSGGHIPSRLFRHLQNEYQNSPGGSEEPLDHSSSCGSKSPSPFDRHPNRYNRSFDSDATDIDNTSMASSSFGELDEYYRNGEGDHEAAPKDTPHREITSQLEVPRRKPRAAPGKVFRYLQMTYDTMDDSDSQYESQRSVDSGITEEEQQDFGNKSSKVPSPSFRHLQNQYQDNINSLNNNLSKEYVAPDAPIVEEEPPPYRGGRTPGKTFSMLDSNTKTHPSVFQARK